MIYDEEFDPEMTDDEAEELRLEQHLQEWKDGDRPINGKFRGEK